MARPNAKPYRRNTAIFYIFIVLAIIYIGYAIIQGGSEYQKEKRAATEEYRDAYISKIETFRSLEEKQIESFLRYYENQAGSEAITLMETYAEDLIGTEKEKMRYYAQVEPPIDFVGFQAYDFLASSLIKDGLEIMLENSEGKGRDFNTGVTMVERGLEMMPLVSERYNTAKNLREERKDEVEK